MIISIEFFMVNVCMFFCVKLSRKKKQTIDQNMKRKWKEALSMCLPEVWYSFYSVDGKQVRMKIKKATLKTNEQVLVEMMFLHQQHWHKEKWRNELYGKETLKDAMISGEDIIIWGLP